jgi:hypothetical protein
MTAHNHNDYLVIAQSHANIIWWAAWMSLGASVHAVYIQQSGFAVVPACVLGTSLNYWRNPVRNSLRRTADMSTVLIGLCYQSALAYNMNNNSIHRRIYFNCIFVSGLCFMMGHLFMALNMPRIAACAHAGIHVVANMGNIALQRGAMTTMTTHDNPNTAIKIF